MTRCAQEVFKAFDLLESACRAIQDNDRCDDCPLRHNCLEGIYGEPTVVELADLMNPTAWDMFLAFADSCVPSDELQQSMDDAREYDEHRDRQYERENF